MKNKTINKAKELLKELEGLYLKPYKCPANKWTIGYGDNLEANGLTADEAKLVDFDKRVISAEFITRWQKAGIGTKEIKKALDQYHKAINISKATAEVLLDNEVKKLVQQLTRYDYFNDAPERVRVALICICFQCGFVGMHKNIYILVKRWPGSGTGASYEKKYFIDYIRSNDYNRASAVLKNTTLFKATKERAIKMADLIYKEKM
ncbi:lysozyme [Gammaproteobacteria bacterium]